MFVSTAKSRNVTSPKKLLSRVLEIRKRGEKNVKKKNGLSTFQQTIFRERRRTTSYPNILRVLRSDRAAAEVVTRWCWLAAREAPADMSRRAMAPLVTVNIDV